MLTDITNVISYTQLPMAQKMYALSQRDRKIEFRQRQNYPWREEGSKIGPWSLGKIDCILFLPCQSQGHQPYTGILT